MNLYTLYDLLYLSSSLSYWFFPSTPLFSVWAWVCTKQCLFQYCYFMIPPCSHGSSEAQSKPYYSDYSPTRLLIHKMCTSHYLDLFITIVIGLNVITMSMEHYQQPKVLLGMPVMRVHALVDIPLRKWTRWFCNCKQCYSKFNSLLSDFMALHNICWLGSWCLCTLFAVPHFDYILAVSI